MNEFIPKVSNKHMPEILTHPNIPKPLHGVNPRTIFGKEWWDTHRVRAYEAAGQHCQACLTPRQEAWPNAWLEAHENFEFRPDGKIVFKGLVALCPACHKWIHSGLRSLHLDQGVLTEEMNGRIEAHAEEIIEEYAMFDEWSTRHDWCEGVPWEDFRMVVNGIEYGPSTSCFLEWQMDEWKNWKPNNEED